MGTVTVYIKDWGWIKCSPGNTSIVEDEKGELFYKIKTNAIDLVIPRNETKIKEGA